MKSMRWNLMAPLSIAVLIFLLAGYLASSSSEPLGLSARVSQATISVFRFTGRTASPPVPLRHFGLA